MEEILRREQRFLYLERVAAAGRFYAANQLPQARQSLDACPAHLRGWEWHFLDARLRSAPVVDPRKKHDARTLAEFGNWAGSMAVAPDGARVAVGPRPLGRAEEGSVRILDARTGAELHRFPDSGPVAFHPDSRWLATIRQTGVVTVWDVVTGAEVWSCPIPGLKEPAHASGLVAFSPDRKRLAAWLSRGRGVHIFGAASGSGPALLDTSNEFMSWLGFSDDGRLAANTATGVAIWNTANDNLKHLANWPATAAVAWSPDGKLLATAERDRTICLRDATTGEVVRPLVGTPVRVVCAAFNADGSRLVTGGSDGSVRLWDVETGQELLHSPPAEKRCGRSSGLPGTASSH